MKQDIILYKNNLKKARGYCLRLYLHFHDRIALLFKNLSPHPEIAQGEESEEQTGPDDVDPAEFGDTKNQE